MDLRTYETNGLPTDDTSTTKSQKRRYSSGSSSSRSQQACAPGEIIDQMRHDDPAIIDLTVTIDDPAIIDLTGSIGNTKTNLPKLNYRDLEGSAVKGLEDNPMGPLFSRLNDSKYFQRGPSSSSSQQSKTFSDIENKARPFSPNPPLKKHKKEEDDSSPETKDEFDLDSYKSLRTWEWTTIGRQCLFGNYSYHGTDFTVMSYNVLAQNLLYDNINLYVNSEEKYLEWNYRKHVLLHEIKEHLPDVLCLQEVNLEHYKSFFVPELSKLGYKGEFQKRTGSDKFDGCATFYNAHRFKMVKCSHLCYKRQYSILDRDNVALIMKLEPVTKRKRRRELCVANTHLLFNPKRGDIKLAQMVLLLTEIKKMSLTLTGDGHTTHIPTILCGDFNLVPESDLYQFLADGYLNFEGLLTRTLSGQRGGRRGRESYLPRNFFPSELNISDHCTYVKENQLDMPPSNQKSSSQYFTEDEIPSSSSAQIQRDSQGAFSVRREDSGCLWHNLNFVSSYKHRIERLGKSVKEVTTHHGHDSAIVDFIFYNRNHRDTKEGCLTLLGRLGLMSEEELNQIGTFPSKHHPSDHLPILSRFLLD
ncbi:protein angel homolog 2-like isoform X2 [Mizuhopecten yessoensis]|nr:protein angel homolog 2-like isoform X2 [Mizuhopecten yessoensis]XP_021346986.1 protein angel homolog 2-like isoform X2 [Mizuhopecten yessoensis]XP_021346987.1 protein angel homolog 2-like isoform X2 [Mizuhopecten yessoensis]